MTPSALAAASTCYCFNDDTFKKIVAYLLDQINSGGGGSFQDLQVTWAPTNTKLSESIGFSTGSDIPQTSLSFNMATSLGGFQLALGPTTKIITFPNLVSIDPNNITGAGLTIVQAGITTFSAPLLSLIGGAAILIQQCNSLTSVSLPSMVTAFTGIDIKLCPSLTSISLPNWLPTNASFNDFDGDALNAASVNQILARGVANPAFVAGTIDTSGGTNAAPSGQGIADKATLQGRGVTVNTN